MEVGEEGRWKVEVWEEGRWKVEVWEEGRWKVEVGEEGRWKVEVGEEVGWKVEVGGEGRWKSKKFSFLVNTNKKCLHFSYYRSFVHSCEKCSPCCEDSEMEDHEEQCRRQGIPADRACQYTGRKCGEKAQDLPSDKPTADTGELEDDSILLKKWHVYLVAGLVVLLFILVVVTFVVRLPRVKITNSLKRKGNNWIMTYTASSDNRHLNYMPPRPANT